MPEQKATVSFFDHDQFARSKAPDDFWGQIRRTVNGKPVSEEHIAQIVSAIKNSLALNSTDHLLDLACGNGALSAQVFDSCASLLGVDFSEFLISVAQENFQSLPRYRFVLDEVTTYLRSAADPQRFTKAVCYGSFSYLSDEAASECLRLLQDRFSNVERIFLGNLPDSERKNLFYYRTEPPEAEYKSSTSVIGIWRTKQEFFDMANACGWRATFSKMPESFYASAYRYDVLLTR